MTVVDRTLDRDEQEYLSTRERERFLIKIKIGDEPHPRLGTPCHWWTAMTTQAGHGQFSFRGKMIYAHRFAWEHISRRELPPFRHGGLELSHMCHNSGCVNVDHLELLTKSQHMMESDSGPQVHARRKRALTHCIRGHPLSGDNVLVRRNGTRNCRSCSADRSRRYKSRIRDEG